LLKAYGFGVEMLSIVSGWPKAAGRLLLNS